MNTQTTENVRETKMDVSGITIRLVLHATIPSHSHMNQWNYIEHRYTIHKQEVTPMKEYYFNQGGGLYRIRFSKEQVVLFDCEQFILNFTYSGNVLSDHRELDSESDNVYNKTMERKYNIRRITR